MVCPHVPFFASQLESQRQTQINIFFQKHPRQPAPVVFFLFAPMANLPRPPLAFAFRRLQNPARPRECPPQDGPRGFPIVGPQLQRCAAGKGRPPTNLVPKRIRGKKFEVEKLGRRGQNGTAKIWQDFEKKVWKDFAKKKS